MGDIVRNGVWLRHGVVVEDSTIGPDSFVGFRSTLRHSIVGRGAQIAARAHLAGTADQPVRVGEGVWLGVGVYIAPGVRVGDHAIVGAGAEVRDDVAPLSINVGRPAVERAPVETTADQDGSVGAILEMVRKRAGRDTSRLSPDRVSDPEAFFDCAATIAESVVIGRGAVMIGRPDGPSPDGGVVIGDHSLLGDWLVAEGGGGLRIGSDVVIGTGVTITTSTHDHRSAGRPWQTAPVQIDSGAEIGDDATIVGPVHIGCSARVLAGAVVTKSVPPGQISKGVFG